MAHSVLSGKPAEWGRETFHCYKLEFDKEKVCLTHELEGGYEDIRTALAMESLKLVEDVSKDGEDKDGTTIDDKTKRNKVLKKPSGPGVADATEPEIPIELQDWDGNGNIFSVVVHVKLRARTGRIVTGTLHTDKVNNMFLYPMDKFMTPAELVVHQAKMEWAKKKAEQQAKEIRSQPIPKSKFLQQQLADLQQADKAAMKKAPNAAIKKAPKAMKKILRAPTKKAAPKAAMKKRK